MAGNIPYMYTVRYGSAMKQLYAPLSFQPLVGLLEYPRVESFDPKPDVLSNDANGHQLTRYKFLSYLLISIVRTA